MSGDHGRFPANRLPVVAAGALSATAVCAAAVGALRGVLLVSVLGLAALAGALAYHERRTRPAVEPFSTSPLTAPASSVVIDAPHAAEAAHGRDTASAGHHDAA